MCLVQFGAHRSCRLGTAVFRSFVAVFLFCSFAGVILAPESAWRCYPPSTGAEGAWHHTSPRLGQIKIVEVCRKYKLTIHLLSLIILGIEVGTEKFRAHMIKDMSGYPAWHR